ncbi:MAG: nitrous oxide reductase accessory protein NosL [Campylobacterota bacterium]|nr:nitrous oxide reductase accessory protein NosL [Campylobacterota bacterium]
MIEHKNNRDKNDIYGMPILATIFKNKKFITTIQVLTLALFVYGVYMGFAEPTKENIFTRYLFWGLFWSLFIVVTLSSFGRIFCGICPHGFLGKYITKFGLKKDMPNFLKNRFIGILLLFFGWWAIYYAVPGFWKVPLATAWLFASLTLIAFVMYYLYKDMSYCKYICPIGTLMKSYGKISPTWLGTYKDDCKDCRTFECAKACEYNLKPFTFNKKNNMEDCTLCMDCSSACDAVAFKFTKPSKSLFDKFKYNKADVWAFILITAAISITMSFHHALGRTAIADDFIWAKTAVWVKQYIDFGTLDAVGIFAFSYAVIFSIGIVYIGMFIASRIMNTDFEKTFYTLGYSFAPLFVIGGLAHLMHSFFTHTYADIVNGFLYGFGGFGLDFETVKDLATRKDGWLNIFNVIPYIAAVWGYIILAKRLKQFEATKIKKVFAFIFASSLISFYLFLQLYKGYAFATYGAKKGGHGHHGASTKMFQSVPFKDATLLQAGENKTSGIVCGMNLPKFYKTNHSATLDGKVRQYCSIHCIYEDLIINKLPLKNIQVVDIKNLKFIDAAKAFYVVGSKKRATMSITSKYAFSNIKDANSFIKKYGGNIVTFDEALNIAKKDFNH